MAKKTGDRKIKKKPRGRKVKSIEEIKTDIRSKSLSIRTLIDSSTSFKLGDLQPLVSRAMADELGINHGRLHNKLRNPVKFSMSEIHRFANYTESNVEKLTALVNKEIRNDSKLRTQLTTFKGIEYLKKYTKAKQRPAPKS